MPELIDIKSPCAPGSLMRTVLIDEPGRYRIARRDAELYSVQVVCSGAWGRAKVTNGLGRDLWHQPSTFTGSFVLGAEGEGGLIVEVYAMDLGAHLTINYRELDQRMI